MSTGNTSRIFRVPQGRQNRRGPRACPAFARFRHGRKVSPPFALGESVSTGEVRIRAVPLRSKRLNDAADDAYGAKYTTKANEKYVKGFRTPGRKVTTLELVPV
jgi:hypothetical protein